MDALTTARTKVDFGAAWIAWLGGRSPETVRARLADLRSLGAFLGAGEADPRAIACQIAEEIPGRVRAFAGAWSTAQAASGIAGTTIARRISTVASWFGELTRHGGGPVPVLLRPRTSAYERGACPAHSHVELAIATLHRDGRVAELAALLLMADCGLRRSEACSLAISDLLEGPPPAVTVTRKGGRRVTRTLSLRAHAAIVAAIEGRTAGPLLASPLGRPYSPASLAALVAALELGTPHALRRSGATHLYHSTHDAELVRQWLDHRNLSTTQLYVRALDDTAGDATRILAGE